MDLSENAGQLFYAHMGHTEAVNRNIYQTPLVEQELLQVGTKLHYIDKGTIMFYIHIKNLDT